MIDQIISGLLLDNHGYIIENCKQMRTLKKWIDLKKYV